MGIHQAFRYMSLLLPVSFQNTKNLYCGTGKYYCFLTKPILIQSFLVFAYISSI